jgi:hypothetical protein
VLTRVVAVWHILALSIGLGTAFDVPARQSLLIQMVEGRDDLISAIGLNSAMILTAGIIAVYSA